MVTLFAREAAENGWQVCVVTTINGQTFTEARLTAVEAAGSISTDALYLDDVCRGLCSGVVRSPVSLDPWFDGQESSASR
jgi:hypothetical protein